VPQLSCPPTRICAPRRSRPRRSIRISGCAWRSPPRSAGGRLR